MSCDLNYGNSEVLGFLTIFYKQQRNHSVSREGGYFQKRIVKDEVKVFLTPFLIRLENKSPYCGKIHQILYMENLYLKIWIPDKDCLCENLIVMKIRPQCSVQCLVLTLHPINHNLQVLNSCNEKGNKTLHSTALQFK